MAKVNASAEWFASVILGGLDSAPRSRAPMERSESLPVQPALEPTFVQARKRTWLEAESMSCSSLSLLAAR